uniref:Uncharacterized protein n=1 Tax=Myripristis murdjan TaxID=586833 RepID=A0A668APP4_9TELE
HGYPHSQVENMSTTLIMSMIKALSCLLSEDQFLCSICLDVFTDPVSTPCGHNFCKTCITQHWDINTPCQCPMCKKPFPLRPELHKASSHSDQQCAKLGEVLCDVCTGTKLKALKSCLVCLASYCETHLEPHQRITGLKTHQLIDPVENLEGRMCKKHDAPLQLFCKTDQMCLCMLCTSDHKAHDIIPLKEEYEGKKAELGETEAEIQQMIQKRRVKIQEIKRSVELSREDAEGFIKELQQEISELMRRSTEVEQLSHTEDHLHLLQSFPSLSAPPHTKNWTEVRVHRSSYVGSVRRAVAQLEETLSKEMKKLCADLDFPSLSAPPHTKNWTEVRVHRSSYVGSVRRAVAQLEETLSKEMKNLCADLELRRVQHFEVDVTLDPDTAYPALILSDDGKQVKHGDVKKNLPNNSERFSHCPCVLGKQSISSGRFYYEVRVKGKTDWDLGVASGLIERKGNIPLCPKNGYWTIWLRNQNEYDANADPPVRLSLKSQPQKVGVFVDYEEGLVSFYDVDTAALIYSYSGCSFTEKLHPYFCPCVNDGGKNSAPLIICPVNQTE